MEDRRSRIVLGDVFVGIAAGLTVALACSDGARGKDAGSLAAREADTRLDATSNAETDAAGFDAAGFDAVAETDAAGTDASHCRKNGESFDLPADTDPWTLYRDGRIHEFCCETSAARIVAAEQIGNGVCRPYAPPRFVCVPEPTDDECQAGEDFCTSPTDCFPPDNTYPLCCGPQDACQGLGPGHSRTGASGCCAGLELIPLALWSHTLGGCVSVPFPDFGICVPDCGDGICAAGENGCNCPADCPL